MTIKRPTLYSQIKRVADKIVEHYREDITVHDKAILKTLKDGDLAVWAAYKFGSHMARLCADQNIEEVSNALNLFDAQRDVFPGMQWYCLEQTGRTMWKVTEDEARTLFTNRIKHLDRDNRYYRAA